MELEELKNIWKKNPGEYPPLGEQELASMMKGQSKSLVAKLKRSVWFELVFTALAGIALLIYALNLPDGALKWISVSFLVLFVAYSFYYTKKLLLLNKFEPGVQLRTNLVTLVGQLSHYLEFYQKSYAILYPVYFCLGLIFAALERGSQRFFEVLSQPRTIAYLALLGGVLFFLSMWFTRWYLKKLYGNHLEKLKSLVRELDSSDDAG